MTTTTKSLPVPVCSVVGDVLGNHIHNHNTLNRLFYDAGAVGEPPSGSCVTKATSWFRRMHEDVPDPAAVLGKALEEFMEVDASYNSETQEVGRQSIREVLGRYGLSYHVGGHIIGAEIALSTKSLTQLLKERNLAAVDKEFERALANVEADPPAAITAACSILESLFKLYIADNGIEMPGEQTLKPLWKVVSKHLGLDASMVEDDDIKRILSGMSSAVDGIGALRTHAGSAHGRGKQLYRVQARHC